MTIFILTLILAPTYLSLIWRILKLANAQADTDLARRFKTSPRSQVSLGNALVAATSLPSGTSTLR